MQLVRTISSTPAHFIGSLLKSRSTLINVFLFGWLLVLAVIITGDLLTPEEEPLTMGRNLLLAVGVLGALWQNRLARPAVAMATITGMIFLVVTTTAIEVGLQGPATILDRYFVPTVLAGLLLQRRALLITGAATIAVVLALYGLQAANQIPLGAPGLTELAGRTTLQFLAVYVTLLVVLDQFGSVVRDNLARQAERDGRLNAALQAHSQTTRELEDERRLNQAIVSNIPGLLFVIDRHGNVVLSGNRNLRTAPSQYPVPITEMLPEVDADSLRSWVSEVMLRGKGSRQFELLGDDGQPRSYTLDASRLQLADRPLMVSVGLDTTELTDARRHIQELNSALETRLQRLTALHQIDQSIIANLDLEVTLDVILGECVKLLNADAVSILLYRHATDSLQWTMGRGFSNPRGLKELTLSLGEGVAGKVGQDQEYRHLTRREDLESQLVRWSHISQDGFVDYLAIPLVTKGNLQGVLELFHREPLEPDDDWRGNLTALAIQAAIALENASLVEGLEQANTDLLQSYETTIEGWSRALDLRDHETEGHSRRVTDLTMALARRLGLPEEELVHVRRGALLHDIGKMGVPDRILLKAGKLDDDEWRLMQEHPKLAYEMLAPIRFLQPALAIPYSHHEKWDGSGYPQGLSGEQIPRAARIFALADVYDALTSDRPYRRAWTAERALELIESEAGKQFDPVMAREFVAMMRQA